MTHVLAGPVCLRYRPLSPSGLCSRGLVSSSRDAHWAFPRPLPRPRPRALTLLPPVPSPEPPNKLFLTTSTSSPPSRFTPSTPSFGPPGLRRLLESWFVRIGDGDGGREVERDDGAVLLSSCPGVGWADDEIRDWSEDLRLGRAWIWSIWLRRVSYTAPRTRQRSGEVRQTRPIRDVLGGFAHFVASLPISSILALCSPVNPFAGVGSSEPYPPPWAGVSLMMDGSRGGGRSEADSATCGESVHVTAYDPEPRRMILLVFGLLATGPSPLRPETGMEGTENPPSCCPFLSVYSHNMGGSRGTP